MNKTKELFEKYAPGRRRMKMPLGMRWLKPGDILQNGDQYFIREDHWGTIGKSPCKIKEGIRIPIEFFGLFPRGSTERAFRVPVNRALGTHLFFWAAAVQPMAIILLVCALGFVLNPWLMGIAAVLVILTSLPSLMMTWRGVRKLRGT